LRSAGDESSPAPIGQLARIVCERLEAGGRVRRSLPGRGRLHIDRQLPFLVVYRRPASAPDPGTDRLVTSEAAYLVAPSDGSLRPSLGGLLRPIVRALRERFGAFLLLELWAGDCEGCDSRRSVRPHFRIVAPQAGDDAAIDALAASLSRVRVGSRHAEVRVTRTARWGPRGLPPLLPASVARKTGCSVVGLEVRAIYRGRPDGPVYPAVLRELDRQLSRARRQAFHRFARARTIHCPVHYQVLGRRALVKAVWEVDRRLADVSDSFDFLLQVTPVDAEEAWLRFRGQRFRKPPSFHYRPLPVDPAILKRRLFEAPIERVEDPALWELLRQKQDELDRRITMLQDMNTPRFAHGSVQLFGPVDDALLERASSLLARVPPRTRDDSREGFVDAAAFARRAEEEIEHYRGQWPRVEARVLVRGDIAAGLMVSHGSLLVGGQTRVPASRVEALLQHEVGTHILTYYNGRAQPLRQLYCGLAGYEALQEGLAVLAEHLVGGLTRPRLRLLAARVVAVRRMLAGASFIDTFRELHGDLGLDQRTAFTVAMRVHRGGGLTKDALYLRGLVELLEHLRRGGRIEPLLVGKIAAAHLPVIAELRWRGVLAQPPLRPRYLDDAAARRRLLRLRRGMSLLDLADAAFPGGSDAAS
jgi:uncharacterized protein (TIGR02421 family)